MTLPFEARLDFASTGTITHTIVMRQTTGYTVGSHVFPNIGNGFNPNSVSSLDDQYAYHGESDNAKTSIEQYEYEIGLEYKSPIGTPANVPTPMPSGSPPNGAFHRDYASIDYYFGPVRHMGFQSDGTANDSRIFDVLGGFSFGSHVAADYPGPGTLDSGARYLPTVVATITYPVTGDGRSTVYASYTKAAQYYDGVPKPYWFNDYGVGFGRQIRPGLEIHTDFSSLTRYDDTAQFQLPSSLTHAVVDIYAKIDLTALFKYATLIVRNRAKASQRSSPRPGTPRSRLRSTLSGRYLRPPDKSDVSHSSS